MNEIPNTFGDYPRVLYRCFKKKKHALMFIEEGIVRLGLLNYYKNIEDNNRQDESEGEGSVHIPGEVTKFSIGRNDKIVSETKEQGHLHYRSSSGNAIYILSCVFPPDNDISKISSKFGSYIVRINDPRRLGQDITNKLWENAEDIRPIIECTKIIYNKGHFLSEEFSKENRWKLSFIQKPERFNDEYEYRLVAIEFKPALTKEEFMYVKFGCAIEYAELLAS